MIKIISEEMFTNWGYILYSHIFGEKLLFLGANLSLLWVHYHLNLAFVHFIKSTIKILSRFRKRLLGRACNDRRFRNPCIARKGGRGLTHAKMVKDHTFSHFFVPFRPQRWSIFQSDGMVNVFFRPPLTSMVFQWFWQCRTITIECFLRA